MPVALTDHVDRSVEKSLLRGKVGRIHSWVPHHEECSDFVDGVRILKHLPAVVFVKFEEKWQGCAVDLGRFEGAWAVSNRASEGVLLF